MPLKPYFWVKPKLRIEEARKARKKPCFLAVTKPMCSEWDCNIYLHWSQKYVRHSHVGQNIPVPFEAFWETQNITKKEERSLKSWLIIWHQLKHSTFFGGGKIQILPNLSTKSCINFDLPIPKQSGSNWSIPLSKSTHPGHLPNAPPGPVTFRRWSLHQNSLPGKFGVKKRWPTGIKYTHLQLFQLTFPLTSWWWNGFNPFEQCARQIGSFPHVFNFQGTGGSTSWFH